MQGQTKKLRINHLSFFCEIKVIEEETEQG